MCLFYFAATRNRRNVQNMKHVLTVSKGAKIRNRYNLVPHLTQDTNGKVTNSQQDTTNASQEVSPFPAGDHKVHTNRRAQRHSKRTTENIKDPQRSTALERPAKYFHWRAKTGHEMFQDYQGFIKCFIKLHRFHKLYVSRC